MTPARRMSATIRSGFTLIELIVVIAIIGILSAIALLVGNRVTESGRIDLTKSLLRVLDKTQDSYFADRDAKVPYKYTDLARNEWAVADGRFTPTSPANLAEPSTTFYLLATQESTSVQSTIGSIDSRFVVRAPISHMPPPSPPDPKNFSNIYTQTTSGLDPLTLPLTIPPTPTNIGLVIKDPWGNAIRFVHPKFQGGSGDFYNPRTNAMQTTPSAGRTSTFNFSLNQSLIPNAVNMVQFQLQRSYQPSVTGGVGDADEGLCAGGRGYFYSPGKDGDPGTRIDNVYLDAPQFPTETAKLAPIQ